MDHNLDLEIQIVVHIKLQQKLLSAQSFILLLPMLGKVNSKDLQSSILDSLSTQFCFSFLVFITCA